MNDVLNPKQRQLALEMIQNPPFGSALEKANRWGVDLHALVDNLCLTPTERIRKSSRRMNLMLERARRKQLRKAMRNKGVKTAAPHPPAETTE